MVGSKPPGMNKERIVKVYLCYECDYNGCDVFKNIVKIVDEGEKAVEWCMEIEHTEYNWREYHEHWVES